MAKLVGVSVLDNTHSLYTNIVSAVPFTNRGGPAHHIDGADVDTAGTFASSAGTEADAWPATGDPVFSALNTSSRRYNWSLSPLTAYPFTMGVVFKATNTNPGFVFLLYDAADTGNYINLQCSGFTSGITFKIGKTGSTAYSIKNSGSGQFVSGTWYSIVVTVDQSGGNASGGILYKNNVDLAVTPTGGPIAFPTTINRISIGTGDPVNTNAYAKGDIDFFCMFNTILSAADRTKIHDEFAAGATPTWGLLAPSVTTQDIAETALLTETTTAGIETAIVAARHVVPIRPPLMTDLTARPLIGRGAERGL